MITKFETYINESYLEGGRQPLYHYTRNLKDILETDILKTHKAADNEISISFTRSLYYEEHCTDIRLVLDADKLKNDGYKIIPYDEVGNAFVSKSKKKKLNGYTKANPYYKGRGVINNVGITAKTKGFVDPEGFGELEWEYEERCFNDIKNLGKYLIAIDLSEYYYELYSNKIKEYLEKYPHIEIIKLNKDCLYDRRQDFKNHKKEKEFVNSK